MDEFYVALGQLIKEKRLQKNLTTQQLADTLGVSIGYLSNIENAKTDAFNIELIVKLSKTLDISLLNFLPLSEDTLNSGDVLKRNQAEDAPATVEELLSTSIESIVFNYINSIKNHEYNPEFIIKITEKILHELNFISNFKLS